ncbi:MAG TPA: hypothetical protein VGM81_08065 [Burkholderiaceae bacterium]|jgi:hypothetical protein
MMIRILIVVALVWIALMPPLFTHGACTAEFESVEQLVKVNQQQMRTAVAAEAFLRQHGIQPIALTSDECNQSKPRWVNQCQSGTLVYAHVPVKNKVCSFYRDDQTLVQLQYDIRDRLVRVITEMKPYKFWSLPWGGTVDWAK